MGFVKEFKQFAMRGNVIDLAMGIIIGAAFGKIVSALVDNIIMPFIGTLLQGVSFEKLVFKVGDSEYKYGLFFGDIIDFIIIAFVLFMLIKGINNLRKKEADAPSPPPAPTSEEKLLGEIRDLLKDKRTS
jgi:large conductance mechanosensitive channel